MDDDRRDSGIKSVHLALDVLEAVATQQGDAGVSELAQLLGTTKGTIFRHLQTLTERGYLTQNGVTQRYRLGARSLLLGQLAADRIDLTSASQDAMRRLREEIGETVVLSVIDARGPTVLTTMLGKASLEIGVRPGSELELHSSAQGKIALTFSRRPFLSQLRRRGLTARTAHTIPTMAALEDELAAIRKSGYATAPEEMALGINAVAAPVFDSTGDAIAALALVGSVQYIPRTPDPRQVEAVLRAAEAISWNLGYSGRQAGAI